MIKLGVIGMSEGNGHPYSWAAICNGFSNEMDNCPFPSIPEYLKAQNYPEDFIENAEVTHIWTQDHTLSEHIAKCANIKTVCLNLEDMIGHVDGVLLARDDAENHFQYSIKFLKAGIPIYIDKPIAHSKETFSNLMEKEQYEGQIYTCSALRFADEILLTEEEQKEIGTIQMIQGFTPKSWKKYAIHIIEPIVSQMEDVNVEFSEVFQNHQIVQLNGQFTNGCLFNLTATGNIPCPISFVYIGENGTVHKKFTNSFQAFKSALEHFIQNINSKKRTINLLETKAIENLIELGIKN